MSRFGWWGSRILDLDDFDLLRDPHACVVCGGAGVVFESIDEERLPVAVPCHGCKTFCKICNDWVKKKGHDGHHSSPHP